MSSILAGKNSKINSTLGILGNLFKIFSNFSLSLIALSSSSNNSKLALTPSPLSASIIFGYNAIAYFLLSEII